MCRRAGAGRAGGAPRSPAPFGKPGDLQIQAPLQPPSGGRADRVGFEELGQLGVLRRDEIAQQPRSPQRPRPAPDPAAAGQPRWRW